MNAREVIARRLCRHETKGEAFWEQYLTPAKDVIAALNDAGLAIVPAGPTVGSRTSLSAIQKIGQEIEDNG